MIEAGKLRERITIQRATTRKNAHGQVVTDAVAPLATVWAGKWQLSTKDVTRQAGQSAQAEAKFLIRFRDDIKSTDTVLYRGKTYSILGTEEYEDRTGLFLFVRAASE